MRRSVEEGVKSRFVTGQRVEAILKVCLIFPYLCHLGSLYSP